MILVGASGFSYEDAAAICGCAVGTIKSRVNRARSKLSALLYVDGADECDPKKRLIKGGGGALTREKIIAAAAKKFLCIVDPHKCVDVLGKFPLPIEVIPMARSLVAREIVRRGGTPVWRDGCVTDNGNWILDVHGWRIDDPLKMETGLNQIAGVVTVGLFAHRAADVVLVGGGEMA